MGINRLALVGRSGDDRALPYWRLPDKGRRDLQPLWDEFLMHIAGARLFFTHFGWDSTDGTN